MFWNGQKTSRKLLLTCVLCVAIAAWCSLWMIQNQRTQQYWTSRPMSHSYLQTVSVKPGQHRRPIGDGLLGHCLGRFQTRRRPIIGL